MRKDWELANRVKNVSLEEFEICDWPTFDNNLENFAKILLEKFNRLIPKYYNNKVSRERNGDTTFGLLGIRDYNKMINEGVDYLSAYNIVTTIRLHGHILALLMGVPSVMIDNNYGKNSSFHETWLKNIPNSKCVKSQKEFENEMQNLKNDFT